MNLSGKQLLITGGARRIGAAIARRMASAGCKIALHCHNSADDAAELLAALPGNGHTLHVLDLAAADAPEQLFSMAGKCDLLVNNAAIFYRPGSPEDLAASAAYRQINYRVPERLLQIFAAQGLAEGAALNITDCAALNPGCGGYWQSKRDLNALTENLAVPWGKCNLRINAIAPGAVLPPAWAPESQMTKILAATPLHRATAPEDIAELAEFLFRCDAMSGAVIPLDGALHLCS